MKIGEPHNASKCNCQKAVSSLTTTVRSRSVDQPTWRAGDPLVDALRLDFSGSTYAPHLWGIAWRTRRGSPPWVTDQANFKGPSQGPMVGPWGPYLDIVTRNPIFLVTWRYIYDSNPHVSSSLSYYFLKCYNISPLETFSLEWRSRYLTELKTKN